MSQTRQNLYEGMYVISAKLSDDARHKALDKILAGIKKQGGEVKKIHEQGRKRLAYEINGHRERGAHEAVAVRTGAQFGGARGL